ncbi:MAG: sigma factor-like helix-turn-helix DNA-binding protein [Pirellulaceae bacterium]|nr:sigma factor-like helix-turn-helix DNA-binding protein [Pirellulaceae bacterium]
MNYSLQEDKCLGDSRAVLKVALPADEAHLIELCVNGERLAQKQLYEAQFDQRDLLEWGFSQLEPDLRAILLLRLTDELSYFEIAMSLDIAEGTVASRLSRARRCLREIVSPALDLV